MNSETKLGAIRDFEQVPWRTIAYQMQVGGRGLTDEGFDWAWTEYSPNISGILDDYYLSTVGESKESKETAALVGALTLGDIIQEAFADLYPDILAGEYPEI